MQGKGININVSPKVDSVHGRRCSCHMCVKPMWVNPRGAELLAATFNRGS